jgi:predicted nucleotide-binding protein
VFVIAGRDARTTAAVIAFLRSLDLRVVEWEHAAARTGLPNPYVGDVVEAGVRMADAVVVLLTPDDLVKLRPELVRVDDDVSEREETGQARPNVFYEAGFADAIGRDRTILVEVGQLKKSLTDIAGRHTVRYDGSPTKRNVLVERLRIAGLSPNTTGSDWLSAGELLESPSGDSK